MQAEQIWLILNLMLAHMPIEEREAIISFLKENLQSKAAPNYRLKLTQEFWHHLKDTNRLRAIAQLRDDNAPWMPLGLAVDLVGGMRAAICYSKKS
jgi:hypothetical protein